MKIHIQRRWFENTCILDHGKGFAKISTEMNRQEICCRIRGWGNIRCFWDILYACNQGGVPVSNLANSGSLVSLLRSALSPVKTMYSRWIRYRGTYTLLRDSAINTRPFRLAEFFLNAVVHLNAVFTFPALSEFWADRKNPINNRKKTPIIFFK